jgi:predicted transcriptional regulator
MVTDLADVTLRRRHPVLPRLETVHNPGMTPDAYRVKWGLPRQYPMVAPNYAARRSELAKSIGLGTGGKGGDAAALALGKGAKKA